MVDDLFISFGGALKATGTGRIGGHLVVFGGSDLAKTFFTPNTKFFWDGVERRPVLYHHGLDPEIGRRVLGAGWERKGIDSVGMWVETQLGMRDAYERAIFLMAQAGKLGLSSGSAPHMVEQKASGEITAWPIVEGSLTPTPMEPRIVVQPLRSLPVVSLRSLIGLDRAFWAPGRSGPAWLRAAILQGDGHMNLLEKIKQLVPGLTDEQYAQIGAILELVGLTGAAPQANNQAGGETEPAEGEPMRAANNQQLAAAIASAMQQLGIPQTESIPAARAARPPYQFAPVPNQGGNQGGNQPVTEPVRAAALLRFGELEPAIRAVSNDLYGVDRYQIVRHEQHQAFGRFLRSGPERLDASGQRALRMVVLTPSQLRSAVMDGVDVSALRADLNEAVESLGGYMVPEDIRLDMLERLPGVTAIRPGADAAPTSRDVMTRLKVTGGDKRHVSAMRVTWVGDNPTDGQAKTAPTFGIEKTPVHIVLCTVYIPKALMEDSAYPLTNKISEWASQEFGVDEDTQFTIGDGIKKPEGILPGSANKHSLTRVASGSASAITVDGLIRTRHAVAAQYRSRSVWLMNDSTAAAIAMLEDAEHRKFWQPSLQEGQPDRLLGYPVAYDEAMPDVGSGAFPVVFGDRTGYKIADRIGMSLVRDETTLAEQDLVRMIFRRRLGGQVGDDDGYADDHLQCCRRVPGVVHGYGGERQICNRPSHGVRVGYHSSADIRFRDRAARVPIWRICIQRAPAWRRQQRYRRRQGHPGGRGFFRVDANQPGAYRWPRKYCRLGTHCRRDDTDRRGSINGVVRGAGPGAVDGAARFACGRGAQFGCGCGQLGRFRGSDRRCIFVASDHLAIDGCRRDGCDSVWGHTCDRGPGGANRFPMAADQRPTV